jgi:hypothetical protein
MSLEFCKRTKRARHSGGNAALPWISSVLSPTLNSALQYPLLTMPVVAPANDRPPVVAKLHVCSMDFSFTIIPDGCPFYEASPVFVAFGVYRSSYDTRTGTWAALNPYTASSADRDEWFDLQAEFYSLTNSTTISVPTQPIRYKADFHIDEVISSGQGIFFGLYIGTLISPTPVFALYTSVRFAWLDVV